VTVRRKTGVDCEHLDCSPVPIYRDDKQIAEIWECDECNERLEFLWGEEALKEWELAENNDNQ